MMWHLGLDRLNLIYGACLLVALWVGWLKWLRGGVRRKLEKLGGFIEAIAGRDPIIDKASGAEIAPAVKPLGERMAGIDDTLQKLVTVIESNHDHEIRLTAVESDVDALKTASVERIVTKSESAAMWRAVANADAEFGESTET